jgi:drug/metabolite transporter (DMT)-like permease
MSKKPLSSRATSTASAHEPKFSMTRRKFTPKGAEALFVAAFSYALTGILVREVSPMWGDKAQVVARFAIVLVLLAVYNLWRRHKPAIPEGKLLSLLGLGLTFAIMVLLFTSAIGKTTVANVLFVFYATNMITAFLLGTLILKEVVSRNKLSALILALTGLAVYSGAIAAGNLGITFSILAGVCGGSNSMFSKKLAGVDRSIVLIIQYTIASLFSGLLLLISGDQVIRAASLHGVLLTILFALVIILGSYLTLYGFQNFDVNIGTVIMSTELVFAAVMAYFLFNEVPKVHELLGGVLIFTGSIVGSGVFEKSKQPAAPVAQPD